MSRERSITLESLVTTFSSTVMKDGNNEYLLEIRITKL